MPWDHNLFQMLRYKAFKVAYKDQSNQLFFLFISILLISIITYIPVLYSALVTVASWMSLKKTRHTLHSATSSYLLCVYGVLLHPFKFSLNTMFMASSLTILLKLQFISIVSSLWFCIAMFLSRTLIRLIYCGSFDWNSLSDSDKFCISLITAPPAPQWESTRNEEENFYCFVCQIPSYDFWATDFYSECFS